MTLTMKMVNSGVICMLLFWHSIANDISADMNCHLKIKRRRILNANFVHLSAKAHL